MLLYPMLSCRTSLSATAGGMRNLCVDVGLDGGLESLGVGTDDLGDLVTILEEEEGGHGANAEFLCDVRDLVDVKLEEAGVGVCAGELDNLGRDDLARTAPGSEAVKNHKAGLDTERLVEGRLGLEVVDTGVGHSGCVGEELLGEKRSV